MVPFLCAVMLAALSSDACLLQMTWPVRPTSSSTLLRSRRRPWTTWTRTRRAEPHRWSLPTRPRPCVFPSSMFYSRLQRPFGAAAVGGALARPSWLSSPTLGRTNRFLSTAAVSLMTPRRPLAQLEKVKVRTLAVEQRTEDDSEWETRLHFPWCTSRNPSKQTHPQLSS